MPAPAPLTLTLYQTPWFRKLAFPTPDQQPYNRPDAAGSAVICKLQAVRVSNTW